MLIRDAKVPLHPSDRLTLSQLDACRYTVNQMKPTRIAPADNRQSAELVRTAVRKTIRETEEERTRLAYVDQPDAEAEADEWSSADQWKS
jgi:hypothetical protein